MTTEMDRMRDREARFAANEPPCPPCPAWCRSAELFADHTYESVTQDEQTYSRFHVSGLGECVAQEEFNRGGVVTMGPVHILHGGDAEQLSAAEARQRAAELLKVADEMDRITGPLPAGQEARDGLLTEVEAAAVMGLSVTRLRVLAAERKGPRSLQLGRQTVYRGSDVSAWLRRSRTLAAVVTPA
jgi:predicted DNA-binding transcriptional regulator AlpA